MFGWEFPPHNSGGLGVACQGISRALTKLGTELVFVLPREVDTNESFKFVFAESGNSKNYSVNSLLTPYVTSPGYSVLRKANDNSIYGKNLFSEVLRYALNAKEIALKEDFDVIHAHDWLSFLAGIEAKKVSQMPLVVHVHATEFDRGGGNINPEVYEIEKAGMEAADRVVTVSEYTKNIVTHNYGIDPSKIVVVHNGIDAVDYPEKEEDDLGLNELKKQGYKIVLFLGRITLQKGPDYFLRAAEKILRYSPKTMFVVVGSGDMEGQMMEEASQMGISGNFLFAGFLRDAARSRIYHSADAYVMPSVSEPFGITALESLLHGTPVVMSRQSGASEVVLHAMKTDFWDTDEMADQILSILENPSMKEEMGKNGEREALSCSWLHASEKLQKVYGDLIS